MLQVTSVVPTAAGRLLFARLDEPEHASTAPGFARRVVGQHCRCADLGDRRRGRAAERASARRSSSRGSATSASSTGRSASRVNRRVTASWSCCRPDATWHAPAEVRVATGGATRSASVRAGLASFPATPTSWSCTTRRGRSRRAALFARVDRRGARPAPTPRSRLARHRHGEAGRTTIGWSRRCRATISSRCRRRRRSARAALEQPRTPATAVGTDDAALVEAAGGTVVVVEGEPRNLKITRRRRPRARAGADRRSARTERTGSAWGSTCIRSATRRRSCSAA